MFAPLRRPPLHRRLASWWVTGPPGHFAGGTLDLLGLAGRMAWAGLTRRPAR